MCANSSTAPAGGLVWAGSVMSSRRAEPSTTLAPTRPFRYVREHAVAPPAGPDDCRAVRVDRRLPPQGEVAGRGVQPIFGGGQRGGRGGALGRARSGDALELDVDPEVPPRGVRH